MFCNLTLLRGLWPVRQEAVNQCMIIEDRSRLTVNRLMQAAQGILYLWLEAQSTGSPVGQSPPAGLASDDSTEAKT